MKVHSSDVPKLGTYCAVKQTATKLQGFCWKVRNLQPYVHSVDKTRPPKSLVVFASVNGWAASSEIPILPASGLLVWQWSSVYLCPPVGLNSLVRISPATEGCLLRGTPALSQFSLQVFSRTSCLVTTWAMWVHCLEHGSPSWLQVGSTQGGSEDTGTVPTPGWWDSLKMGPAVVFISVNVLQLVFTQAVCTGPACSRMGAVTRGMEFPGGDSTYLSFPGELHAHWRVLGVDKHQVRGRQTLMSSWLQSQCGGGKRKGLDAGREFLTFKANLDGVSQWCVIVIREIVQSVCRFQMS